MMKNQVQLITYADSLGGSLQTLYTVLTQHFHGLFGGVHILPFYPSSGDRGFAPIDYSKVDPAFGTWEDVRRIGAEFDVVADVMINHISRRSPVFQDFLRHGRRSPHADMFITLDKVWSGGTPPEADVSRIFLRRPDHPFADITIEATGEVERVWATFGHRYDPEQIDLDVHSPLTRKFIVDLMSHLRSQGITIIRLDAVGYVIKKPGTSCFFVDPEIFTFMDWLEAKADELDMTLLPEVHAQRDTQLMLAENGSWVYDFTIPLLTLHTLFTQSSTILREVLLTAPRQQFTMLDCHDGIPVQPDLDGILPPPDAQAVVTRVLERGANLNRLHSCNPDYPDFEAHQINATYYSALGADDDAYLAARAIQFFAPGVPQVYYVGLLAGENDYDAVAVTGEGRAINRHNYSLSEIDAAVERPVVRRLFDLIRFRNHYPAFDGAFTLHDTPEDELRLSWELGASVCTLQVDLRTCTAHIAYRDEDKQDQVWVL
jgi:sucrose 6(F)-phosphate phosphorylase